MRQLSRGHHSTQPVNPPPVHAASHGTHFALGAALLLAMTGLAYMPALHNGFIWDDDQYITANATLRSLDGLRRIWLEPGAVPQYYPLTFTTFWLEYHLWGVQPFGYHLVNVLLQATNAVLLFLVLRRLRLSGAWMAAAIFAIHPMQVESVAWATERKNVLAGMFFFAALLAYLQAERVDDASSPAGIRWRAYLASLGLFVGALLSKSVACSLPVVLLLAIWWRRGTLDRRSALRLAPMFAVGIAMAATTVWMERTHVGAQGNEFALSFLERCLIAGRALWFYPQTLLWPHRLTFIYPRWSIDAHAWWQYLFPVAGLAVIVALYVERRRFGRGPLVATLCYAGSLAPALGFIDVYPMRYSFVADHFAYFSVVALIVFITAGGARLLDRAGQSRRLLAYAICAPTLVVLALLTAQQCRVYRDLRTLWTDTLAKNPACWMAQNNLGSVLKDEDGNADGAIPHYMESLRLNPDNPEAHNNLGIALASQGRIEDAISHYRTALRIEPAFPAAHQNLGIALEAQGKTADAIAQFREAAQLQPDYPEAHYNLGLALAGQGQIDEAMSHFEQAVQSRPEYADAHYNLGVALGMKGKTAEAIARYQQALRWRPDYPEAHNNLGTALAGQGKTDEAIAHFTQALRLKPDYPEAHNNLGGALQQAGRLDEAITQFQEAVHLNPGYVQARNNLQAALAARAPR